MAGEIYKKSNEQRLPNVDKCIMCHFITCVKKVYHMQFSCGERCLPVIFESHQAGNNISRKRIYGTICMEKVLFSKQIGQWLVPEGLTVRLLRRADKK